MTRNTKLIKTSIKKMEHYEIYKSLTDLTVSVFLARKLIEVNDLLNYQYSANENIKFKTLIL